MAVAERREIEFSAEALCLAIGMSLRAAQRFGLPALRPTGVQFCPREGQIDVVYGIGQAQRAVPLAAEPLGALLVSYCLRARIPMPRRAEKGIRIGATAVILAFKTIFVAVPAPEAPDNTMCMPTSVQSLKWIEPQQVVEAD